MRFSTGTDDLGQAGPNGRSIANRLFLSIFLSFIGLGALITGALIWDVLHRADRDVARELKLVTRAFHDPIADQLWGLDQKELDGVLDAMVRLSSIAGVAVYDAHSGRRLAAQGIIDKDDDPAYRSNRFPVLYLPHGADQPQHLGDAVIYWPSNLAVHRALPSLILILVGAAIKVVLIWMLFQYFARRQLSGPLTRLAEAVDGVDPSTDAPAPITAVGRDDGELTRLQDAFNRLLARLGIVHAERAEYEKELLASRDRLEDAVIERTRALDSERRRAEEANLAKSRFLAMMSHELRTPLNSILGFSRFMIDEIMGRMNNPKYREYATDIQSSAQHLLEVISDILDISKIEAGQITLEESEVDLREAGHAALRLVRPRLDAKGQILEVDIPADLPRLKADGRVLRQVIVNLFSNSIKFSPEGGHLGFRARLDGRGRIVLVVKDTGCGIAEADIPIVLEAFGQARTSPNVAHEGTGLGLSLSKQLVELHGGELTLESELGIGTTVTMTFPAVRTIKD